MLIAVALDHLSSVRTLAGIKVLRQGVREKACVTSGAFRTTIRFLESLL